jgi:hypothetical protein
MTETGTGAGIGRPLMVFAGILIAGQVIQGGLAVAFPDLELPGSVGIVITIVAALFAGQSFAKASGRVMTGAEKMRFALAATVVAVALAAVGFAALFAWYGVPLTPDNLALVLTGDAGLARDMGGWLWVILAVGVVLTWAIALFGVGSGGKSWLKKQEKLAARGR